MREAFVYDAVRTPRGKGAAPREGKPGGSLSGVRPIELLTTLYRALEERGLDARRVGDVVLGCVTQQGEQAGNIAKISALYAGWPDSVSGTTLNRFCASGLDALRYAARQVQCGDAELVVAGGVESMSRVPMFSDGASWFADADVRERTKFVHMGVAADLLATREGITRAELDEFASRSHRLALAAIEDGRFSRSIVAVETEAGAVVRDELPRAGMSVENLSALPAAFEGVGREGADSVCLQRYPDIDAVRHDHTVGSSPGLADAASLVVVGSAEVGAEMRMKPRARLRSFASTCSEPVQMLDGNVACVRLALDRAGLQPRDIDVCEVNESFAVVPLHFQRALDIDPARVTPNGGAIAMGHPLGATGGILLSMALDELERTDGRFAVASVCGGAGVTMSVVLERC